MPQPFWLKSKGSRARVPGNQAPLTIIVVAAAMAADTTLQACDGVPFIAIMDFLPFPALARLSAARRNSEWLLSIQNRLQLRHLRGSSVQIIARGGATHLKPETLHSWFNLFGYVFSNNRDDNVESMVAIQQRLQECIWQVDLLACCTGPDEDNWLHGGGVDHVSCPHCRSLWSGTAAANLMVETDADNEDGSVGFTHFVAERGEPVTLDNPRIRLSLNAHIREPTRMDWQHQSPEHADPSDSCELRVFCISRSCWQVLWHADTRRAYYEESQRFFAAGPWMRAIGVEMYASCDADGLGCRFDYVDLVGYQSMYKGLDGF